MTNLKANMHLNSKDITMKTSVVRSNVTADFDLDKLEPINATFEIGLSGDKHYIHVQDEISALWTINHNLKKVPSVFIVDEEGRNIECEIKIVDINTIKILSNIPFKGTAYLN